MNFHNLFFVPFLISLLSTYFAVKWIIPRLEKKKIVGIDMNKEKRPSIPEMGGLSVIFGFIMGIYSQVILANIFVDFNSLSFYLFASLVAILGVSLIGIVDDLIGMSQRTKAILPFLFSLHLGAFTSSEMFVPFFGFIEFGYFMLLIVPIAITSATNSANMLEGFNGLSCGLSIIISIALIIMSIINGVEEGLYLLFPLLGSLIAFAKFNFYPSKIFPGDSMTLFVGCTIACASIINNLKFEGAVLFLPMILEFFLKSRGNFQAQCFANKLDGNILVHEGRIESLTHIAMQNFKLNEKHLVFLFWMFEALLATILIFSTILSDR